MAVPHSRIVGRVKACRTTSLNDPDWPDVVDRETGAFTQYYGDKRNPAKNFTTHRGRKRNPASTLPDGSRRRGRPRNLPPILIFAFAGTYRHTDPSALRT
jgi:hypothetical protein